MLACSGWLYTKGSERISGGVQPARASQHRSPPLDLFQPWQARIGEGENTYFSLEGDGQTLLRLLHTHNTLQ